MFAKRYKDGINQNLMKLISSVVEENGMKEGTINIFKYYFSYPFDFKECVTVPHKIN